MIVLDKYSIENALFFDIETVRGQKELPKSGPLFESWEYKMRKTPDVDIFEEYLDKAALYAEFNRIVCVSLGRMKEGEIVTKSYAGEDEKAIIEEFFSDLNKFPKDKVYLVGHTITGFDIPCIMRKAIINGVKVHPLFDQAHLKPWERGQIVDIAELWRNGGYYNASLINIAVAMGLEHSKSDIDGSEVSDVFYSKKKDRVSRIQSYCERDIKVTGEIFQKMKKY